MSEHPPLTYPFDAIPQAEECLRVAPGIDWLRMPLPFALDHINLWRISDHHNQQWTLVDTGIDLPDVRNHWQNLLAQYPALTHIIVTHCHPDHLGLAQWLIEQTGVPVSMSLSEYLTACAWHEAIPTYNGQAMVEVFRQHGLDAVHCQALLARGNQYRKGVPSLPAHFHRLLDQQTLHIQGRTWRTIAGYGHSPEHMALYCAELGVLISGDMLLPRISTNIAATTINPESDAVTLYLDSLDKFANLPPDTLVLPSHGRPFRGLHARIAQLKAHHAERCDALVAACTEPRNAGELLSTLFPRSLDTHQVMFAMGEAIAHLNHLAQTGRVVRQPTTTTHQTIRFIAAHASSTTTTTVATAR